MEVECKMPLMLIVGRKFTILRQNHCNSVWIVSLLLLSAGGNKNPRLLFTWLIFPKLTLWFHKLPFETCHPFKMVQEIATPLSQCWANQISNLLVLAFFQAEPWSQWALMFLLSSSRHPSPHRNLSLSDCSESHSFCSKSGWKSY